jgi:HK97 family phage major capsid protein
MPTTYLDRLNDQYDEITEGIETLVQRAADEDRDVTDAEQQQVDRDRTRLAELQTAIEHYTGLAEQTDRVRELRRSVRTVPRTERAAPEDPPSLEDMFPTAGDYAVTVIRAMKGDKDAGERIARATAHQTTADNPGLIPRPILGPVITAVGNERPFIRSITNRTLPTGSFDRPTITQHVAVDKQPAEKAETASRQLKVGKLPVTATTYAGHLNVSRQDIKWSEPAIMQILFADFGHEYAKATDEDAVAQFLASITNPPVAAATADGAGVRAAVFEAAAQIMGTADGAPLPDTMWASPDVWGALGSMTNDNGVPAFPSVTPTATAGNPLGLRLVVDPWLTAGTAIVGVSSYLEWYEDVDGFLYVDEPNVLGQLVGYAGYGAFLNTKPDLFTPISGLGGDTSAASASAKSASK